MKRKCVDRQRKQSSEDLAIHQKRWQGLSHSLCVGWWWKFYYSRASGREGEQSRMAPHRPHFNKGEREKEHERESFSETHLVVKWTLGARSELASISRQWALCMRKRKSFTFVHVCISAWSSLHFQLGAAQKAPGSADSNDDIKCTQNITLPFTIKSFGAVCPVH